MDKRVEYISLAVVFFFGFYLWSLPINDLPFGDVDASTHLILGDYMALTDKPLVNLPYFLNNYNFANNGKIWYPPQYHTDEAIINSLTKDRIRTVYLFNCFACLLIILSLYLVIRISFGFYPAILSSFMIIFSVKDYMFYLMGLWPQTISFLFTPFILYLFYSYCSIDKPRKDYLYLFFMGLAIQFLFHPQGFLYSVFIVILYVFGDYLINKRINIDYKTILICVVIFLVIVTPFLLLSFKGIAGSVNTDQKTYGSLARLFSWYPDRELVLGSIPESFISYSSMYNLWTLPLLLLGLIFVFLNFRKSGSILMLCWIISYYIFTHLDIIGMGDRIIRYIGAEGHIFYPLIALGALFLVSLLKNYLPRQLSNNSRFIVSLMIVSLFLFFIFPETKKSLNESYSGSLGRITQSELLTTQKMKDFSQDKDVYLIGGIVTSKGKFMRVLSNNYLIWSRNIIPNETINTSYILFDYTEPAALGRKDIIDTMQNFESLLKNYTLLYTSDDKILRYYKKNE